MMKNIWLYGCVFTIAGLIFLFPDHEILAQDKERTGASSKTQVIKQGTTTSGFSQAPGGAVPSSIQQGS